MLYFLKALGLLWGPFSTLILIYSQCTEADLFREGVMFRLLLFTSHTAVCVYVCVCMLLFSQSVVSNSLWPHGLQSARLPCPSPSPEACSNSRPLSQWCCSTILSSVIPLSSYLKSFPESGSFLMNCLFASGVQSVGASASVLLMNIQDLFPLGLTGGISLQSNGLSRVFSNTIVQKHQFFGIQPSLWSNFQIHTWLLENL